MLYMVVAQQLEGRLDEDSNRFLIANHSSYCHLLTKDASKRMRDVGQQEGSNGVRVLTLRHRKKKASTVIGNGLGLR